MNTWKKRGKNFSYKKHNIFYMDEGQGDILLCIHGFPTSSWDWNPIWKKITQNFRVIAADMIGFGLSDKPKKHHYSILDQADLQQELLQHLNIKEITILAHDYGDTVTQELLARYNEHKLNFSIKSICLLNGGLFPESHRPRLIQHLLLGRIGFLVKELISFRTFCKNFRHIFGPKTQPTDEELSLFWEFIAINDGQKISHKIMQYIKERKQYRERWVGALVKATIPILFINGAADPISGIHMAERYQQLIPNPQVIILQEIGHYPQVEAPRQVISHFLNFYDKNKK